MDFNPEGTTICRGYGHAGPDHEFDTMDGRVCPECGSTDVSAWLDWDREE